MYRKPHEFNGGYTIKKQFLVYFIPNLTVFLIYLIFYQKLFVSYCTNCAFYTKSRYAIKLTYHNISYLEEVYVYL